MIATILIGWPLLSILLTALWSRYRAAQKAQDREEYEMALARQGIRVINGEYRRT